MIAFTTPQTVLFLESILLGMVLSVIFDVFRIIRIGIPLPSPVIVAEDILYFLICAVVTYFFMLKTTYGQVRGFIIIGEIIGFIIYYFTVGRLVISVSKIIIETVKRIFKLIFKILFYPFVMIFKVVSKKLGFKFQNINKKLTNFKKNTIYGLKTRRRILYNILYNANKSPRFNKKGGDKLEKS